jgi:prevent-host-death family protein
MNATVLDLRKNMKSVLAAIERNEHVTLTYRGRKKAVIVPYRETKKEQSVNQHAAFGMWRDRDEVADVDAHVRELRRGRQF